jgi:hydroxymethylbilane synthase
VSAEREMLTQLQGGCTAPIGAHAEIRRTSTGDERLVLLGLLADPTGTKMYRASHEVAADEAIMLGRAMAATLLETGGESVLAAMRSADGDGR